MVGDMSRDRQTDGQMDTGPMHARFPLDMANATGSHPETVGDMSRVTLNSDLSKIPFVHF